MSSIGNVGREIRGLALAAGKLPNFKLVHKFGSRVALGTSLLPVTTSGTYQTPTAAASLELVSTDNTNDKAGGAGALTVRVIGIQDWDVGEVSQDVSLNGTTAVPVPGTWLRVYRMQVIESGAYADTATPSHNSTITLRGAGAGATWSQIVAVGGFGLGQTEIACYSIGSNKRCYLAEHDIHINSGKSCDVMFFVRENAHDVTTPYDAMRTKISYRSVVGEIASGSDINPLGPFNGPCDVGWMAKSTSTTSDIVIAFEIIEEDIDA